ncbi:MAG: hypothetical protein PF440_00340 [Thiomicrorhabdus sp.]|jgi:hypothetical protein|nr:hypothetical protein [Thiomicrorhabdus sp.]
MGENSTKKISFLPLVSLSSKMNLSDEQLLNYSRLFNIPSQRHSLVGQLKKLTNISKILHCLVPSQYKYLVDITGFLITNREDPLVQQVIISKQTGERSGLASTLPLYDALQKIPNSKTTNIFELILGLAFAIQDLKPDISPNPSLKSNLISISRTIRKQSMKSNQFFSKLIKIEIVSNDLSEIYKALDTYLEVVESEITPELKSLIQYFQTDKTGVVPHAFDESINSVQSNEPSERIMTNVKDRQLLERFSSQATNKTRSSESRIFAILPINNQDTVNSEGTIQEDVVDNDEIIENKTIDGESLSAAGNRVSARAVQQKGVMQSQFCKYRWERLSATEKKIILSEALSSDSIGATCAILTMSFGAEPLVWGEFKIGNQDDMNPYINLNTYVWGHPIKQHENSWIPVSEQEELLYPAKNFITLKVPVSVINKLSKLSQVKAKTISGLLGFNPEQLNIELKTWLLSLQPRNRELTIAKLREELYSTIMDQAMDEVAAHMICTQPTYLLPIQSFYTAISEGKLNTIYDRALFDIFTTKQGCDLEGSPLSGSKLQVKEPVILDLIERLKNQVKSCSPESFIEYHNAFTVYTYLLFSYATGHRLVVDPFAKKLDFIEQSKAVVVYDKETDLNHTGRLCALGDVAWEQYLNYKAHLVELSSRVYSEDKKLRSKILDCLDGKETLPFLFLLERDNNEIKILSIREKTLSLHLHGWQLPFNTQRHYLSSNLRALNVSSEIIDYQLGHFQNGTQELGFASTLSLDKVSDYLGPFLDRLLSNISFQPLESVLRANNVPIKRIKTGKIDLGYKQRLQKRCERKQRAHSVIKNEFQELTPRLIEANFSASNGDFQQLANVLIDKCLQRVLEHKDTLHKGQSLRLFYGVLKRTIQKNRLKLKIDFSFSKVSSDPSPVNSHTGHQYHQFLIIRKIFHNNTCKILELEKTKGLDYLMAFSLLTEVIFGRLHNQAWVNNYCNSISQGMLFKEDLVVINLRSTKRSEAIFRYVCSWEGALFLSARKVNFEDLKDLNQSDLMEKQTNRDLCTRRT